MKQTIHIKKNFAAIGIIIGALSITMQAGGTIVYSENFDNAGFRGSQLDLSGDPVGNVTERWGTDSAYYNINSFDSWSFSGGTYLAGQPSTGNQGVLLNENGGIANTVVGLAPNTFYTLSFNYSGDNRPSDIYGLSVDVNGGNVVSLSGLSWTSVNPAGHQATAMVQADALGNVALKFYQTGGLSASPIIDDVTLSSVPEPTTMVAGALLFLPFGASTLRILNRRVKA